MKYFLFLYTFCTIVTAQSHSDFHTMVDKSVAILYQDPDECIRYTQNILNSETDFENRLILQNIIAQAYAMKGDFVQSIRVSLENDLKNPQIKLNTFFRFIFRICIG